MKKGKTNKKITKEELADQEFPRELFSMIARRIQEVDELVPIRLTDGGYTFKDLEDIDPKIDRTKLLEHMVQNGYLEKKTSETVMTCPSCKKTNITPIFKCKSCNSLAVRRERLIEHKAGGHIHPESAFAAKGDILTCPSCNKMLSPTERRTLGAWFVCSDCGERQAKIAPEYKCLNDGKIFTPVMGEFDSLFKFALTEKASDLLGFDQFSIINNVIQVLEKKGNVEKSFAIQGKSGVAHIFDISCMCNGKRLLIDVSFANKPLDDSVVLASFAKTLEVKNEAYLLIAWPGLSKSAEDLVKFYKINLIQSTSLENLNIDLDKFLEKQN